MADKQLIIDDDFCNAMADYYVKQGEQLDKVISQYVTILQGIKDKAITSGDVSNALGTYITYANKLNGQIGNISTIAKSHVTNFLTRVDSADKYLF